MPLSDALGVQYDPSGNPVSGEAGAAAPTAAVQVAGSDGVNLRVLLTDATGKLQATFTASDTSTTGNLNALNAAVQVAIAGEAAVGFQLAAGTLVGTVVPEISEDAGTTWVQTFFIDAVTGNVTTSLVFGASNTAQTKQIAIPGGTGLARVRVSAFTSGTASATVRSTTGQSNYSLNWGASGAAAPPVISLVGGVNGGNLLAFATDGSGRQIAVGPGATGAAPVGNPVYVAGTDGANLRAILTDATGASVVVGTAAAGSAAVGNPVLVAGVDGSGNVRRILTDTTGRLVMIDERAGTSAVTSVATSTANVNLLAANASRLGATVVNDANTKMFVKLGATASSTSYTAVLAANGYYEVPFDYTGQIDAILSSGSGNARITELTP